MKRVEIIQADITSLPVDAIVNAANRTLLGGGGVDGAIHAAAGKELVEFCRKMGGCRTGQAKVSPGFKLASRFVIHTVGPIWRGGNLGEDDLLASCYRNCLELAVKRHFRSIAFPSISTGAYRFPLLRAAGIAMRTMQDFLATDTTLLKVYMVCFDLKTLNAFMLAYREITRTTVDV
ncbi:MAG: O-acetyl-ADP-ribose deacetylase [Candidatus Cloacimonetes bacterium]|nr:O-acetyl-ADP-ribose deacetylase [Candidatus Cloacimonadota bacterium]